MSLKHNLIENKNIYEITCVEKVIKSYKENLKDLHKKIQELNGKVFFADYLLNKLQNNDILTLKEQLFLKEIQDNNFFEDIFIGILDSETTEKECDLNENINFKNLNSTQLVESIEYIEDILNISIDDYKI